jgi:hypothetical protein
MGRRRWEINHQGKIKICGNNQQPQTIVEGENIFGPVRITRKDTGAAKVIGSEGYTPLILYCSRDKDQVNIKICDPQGKLVKDITDILLGE